MEWRPKNGDLVKTQFGPGIVEKISFERIFVRIIEGSIEGYMSLDDIEPLEIKNEPVSKNFISAPVNSPVLTTSKVASPDKELEASYYSRICIDALRFGLVPDEDLKKLTIGYRNIEEWVISSLPGTEPSKKEKHSTIRPVANQIIGQYGDGKSHLMSTIRYIAKKKGYLIARTEVDGNKVSFSNPNTLLYSLWRNLEGDNLSNSTPLLDLFCKAIHNGYEMPKISFLDTDRIRKMYYLIKKLDSQGDLDNVRFLINDFLSCNDRINATEAKKILKEETRLSSWDLNNEILPIVSSRVTERSYTFIESIIKTAHLSRVAGYKGLIILIDEFEVEVPLLGTSAQRDRFKDNLNILVNYITGKTSYPGTSLGIYFATAGKELDFGTKYIDDMVSGSGGSRYEIKPILDWDLDNPEITRFVDSVHQIYQKAYPTIEDSYLNLIPALEEITQNEQIYESGSIRYFVKQYIGMLDRKYGPPLNN